MDEQTTLIGPLMKAARKFKKLNQAEVAEAMGCSQSALSKMEHNLLVPSAPQWFLFSRFTAIPPENLEIGIIDRQIPINFNGAELPKGFKIPKPYRINRFEKVRELYPFFHYLEKNGAQAEVKAFIESTNIESEFFVDFDNLVNFQMIIDLLTHFVSTGRNTLKHVQEIVELGQNNIYWDHFGAKWKKMADVRDVLMDFSREQLFFQADFQMKVDFSNNDVSVQYLPEFHLKSMKGASEEAIRLLHLYRKCTLEGLLYNSRGTRVSFSHVGAESGPIQLGCTLEATLS